MLGAGEGRDEQEGWVPTTRAEMDAFFGINVYRGVVVIHDTTLY